MPQTNNPQYNQTPPPPGGERSVDKRFRKRSLIKIGMFAASAVGLVILARATPLAHMLEPEWVNAHVKAMGVYGIAVFVGIATLFTAIGAPRQIVSFLGGYAWGVVGGTLLALLGTCLGCLAAFCYARAMGRGFVQRRLGNRMRKLDNVFSQSPLSTTLLLRFLPFTNNLVTNFAAGVSNVPLSWFLLGSCMGYIPQTLLFALLGSGVKVGQTWQVALSVALFTLSLLMAWLLLRKHRRLYKVVGQEE